MPSKLVIGYCSNSQTDESIVTAVERGVNVVIWFQINLGTDAGGQPAILSGPDLSQVAARVSEIRAKGLDVVHLVSIGGWNAPHPSEGVGAEAFYAAWKQWNEHVVAREGFEHGFDGFDIDLEGNDDQSSVYNNFTVACLDLLGVMSQLAKRDGYIVSLVPAESYMDPSTSAFDRSLQHEDPAWKHIVHFPYHGHNTYAYILSRYGFTELQIQEVDHGEPDGQVHSIIQQGREHLVETFDFVTVQFYEGYAHLLYNTTQLQQPASEYLVSAVQRYYNGWWVDFSGCPEVDFSSREVKIQPGKMVIGLANGWADNKKFAFVPEAELRKAYQALEASGQPIWGFAYWCIKDEELVVDGKQIIFAKELRDIVDSCGGGTQNTCSGGM